MRFESVNSVLKKFVKYGNKVSVAGTALSHYCRQRRLHAFLNGVAGDEAARACDEVLPAANADLLEFTAHVLQISKGMQVRSGWRKYILIQLV